MNIPTEPTEDVTSGDAPENIAQTPTPDIGSPSHLTKSEYVYAFTSGFLIGVAAAATFALAYIIVTTVGIDHE